MNKIERDAPDLRFLGRATVGPWLYVNAVFFLAITPGRREVILAGIESIGSLLLGASAPLVAEVVLPA